MIEVLIGLAEAGVEGRLLAGGVQVGGVSKGTHAEVGDALPPFLRIQGGDGGGGGTGAVPQQHGGDVQQVAEQHALQTKVAEKDDGVLVGGDCLIIIVPPHIAMLGQQPVQPVDDPLPDFGQVASLEHGMLHPVILVIEGLVAHPILRQPVPADVGLVLTGFGDFDRKFPQPGQHLSLPAQLFQSDLGGVLGTTEGGDIKGLYVQFFHSVGHKLCLVPAGGSERVDGIVRIAVPDDEQFHSTACLRVV